MTLTALGANKENVDSAVFTEYTEPYLEANLAMANSVLLELSRFSRTISHLVNVESISSAAEEISIIWDKTMMWLNTHSSDIQRELRHHSLVIIAGPMELPPAHLRFRVHDERFVGAHDDRRHQDWQSLNFPRLENGWKLAMPQDMKIAKEFLDALGVHIVESKAVRSPGTTCFHDTVVRYGWGEAAVRRRREQH